MPQPIDGQEINLTLSIGISVYPDDGDDVDAVMHNADTAMYHAKASGRNDYRLFRPDMGVHAARCPVPGARCPFAEAKASHVSKQG